MTLPVAILAGGLATRLQPVTAAIPKSMVPIHGQPFIAHQLRLLQSKGAKRVVLCTGHLGDQIEAFVKDGAAFGLTVEYSRDVGRPLGTGGALRNAAHLLGEAFLVIYGDSYLDCDYAAVEQAFLDSRRDALMTVFRNEDRWDKSNVLFEHGQILKYSKAVGVLATPQDPQTLPPNTRSALPPGSDGQRRSAAMAHIDYGLGAIRTRALEIIPPHAPHDLAGFYQQLLTQGQLAAFEVGRRFYEIGSFTGIRELEEVLK